MPDNTKTAADAVVERLATETAAWVAELRARITQDIQTQVATMLTEVQEQVSATVLEQADSASPAGAGSAYDRVRRQVAARYEAPDRTRTTGAERLRGDRP